MLAAFLTTILFSFSALSGRRLAHYVSGTQANLLRLILGALLVGAWSHLFGFGVGGPVFPMLFLSGCVGFGLGDLALFQAYPRIGTRRTIVMVQCLAAPIGALIEWLWLSHPPTLPQVGWGALILGGVGTAVMPRKGAEQAHGLAAGLLYGFLSALGQGGGAVLSRKAYANALAAGHPLHGVGDGVNAAYQRMLGGILVSALFLFYLRLTHKPEDSRRADWRRAWPWLGANSVLGACLGVTCFQWALMLLPTNIVLPIVATTPLVLMPLTHFTEGDRITRRAVLGGVMAVAGVIGLTLAK